MGQILQNAISYICAKDVNVLVLIIKNSWTVKKLSKAIFDEGEGRAFTSFAQIRGEKIIGLTDLEE